MADIFKKINWQIVARILGYALLSVMLWIGGRILVRLDQISTDLISLKLDLVKMQASMLDKEAIRDIVRVELYERGIR